MTDRFARLAYVLALIPLSIAVFIAALAFSSRTSGDSIQIASVVGTLVVCGAVIAIWRRFVRWGPGWWAYLIGTTSLVLGHVLIWVSILKAVGQCDYTPDLMRVGQSLLFLGLWCGGFALVAWGSVLRRAMKDRRALAATRRFNMTPTAARFAIAIALFPLALGFYLTYYLVDGRLSGSDADTVVCRTGFFTAALIVTIWLLLWRRQVAWSRRQKIVTTVLAAALLVSPTASFLPEGATLFGAGFLEQAWEIVRYASPLFLLAAFIAGTAHAWRSASVLAPRGVNEPGLESGPTAVCGACGYSLRGLRELRCPECGWSVTVDEFVGRLCAELDQA